MITNWSKVVIVQYVTIISRYLRGKFIAAISSLESASIDLQLEFK